MAPFRISTIFHLRTRTDLAFSSFARGLPSFAALSAVIRRVGRLVVSEADVAVRMIRKLRFDELAQLFTVLKGEMSFVGPSKRIKDMDRER